MSLLLSSELKPRPLSEKDWPNFRAAYLLPDKKLHPFQGPAESMKQIQREFLNAFELPTGEGLILLFWQIWLGHLCQRHGYQSPRLLLFFQQGRHESPTQEWIEKVASVPHPRKPSFSLSVVYLGEGNSNVIEPRINNNGTDEDLFLFDRHFAGMATLSTHRERIRYHQVLDKGFTRFRTHHGGHAILDHGPSALRVCHATDFSN